MWGKFSICQDVTDVENVPPQQSGRVAMQFRRWLVCAILSAILTGQSASADVKPHALIGDGMVLQRDMKVPIWGTAGNDEQVTVKFQDQVAAMTATNGKWLVHLEKLKAGGPFEMTIEGKNKIQLKHVYVGDVWICSGQSNMEMDLISTENATQAIAGSNNPNIRLFTVPKIHAGSPGHNVKVIASFPRNAQGRWYM